MSVVPDSAFVTIGESQQTLHKIEQGLTPGGEYPLLRQRFGQVLAMVDRGYQPGSLLAGVRFAAVAYDETAAARNIYLGEEFPGTQYLAWHALRRRSKRIAMLIHNVSSRKRRLPLATLRLCRQLDHMLCLSERSRRDLVEIYGMAAARVSVVGSRVDTDFFTPLAGVVVREQVCAAGAVNRDYGALVEAVRPLGLATKVAADTAWRYSATPIEPARIPSCVEMRSWGNYHNLRRLYAESAVVVVPLLDPRILSGVTVALEAMAMGRPVILSRSPYVEDFLVDGETGYFVPPGDPEALRAKIRHLLAHPAEAERVAARGREFVLSRFTLRHYVDRIMRIWS